MIFQGGRKAGRGTVVLAVVLLTLFFSPGAACAQNGSLTLAAVGDIAFTGGRGQSLGNPTELLSGVAPLLKDADITFGNLETAITRRSAKWPGKTYNFRAPFSATRGLRSAGFDVVSVANNHSLDYRRSGFADTRKALANAGILYTGGGTTVNSARAPRIIKRKGARIAFLAFSEINPAGFAATKTRSGTAYTQSITVMTNAVKAAAKTADYVVVSVHWGVEKSYDPTLRQRRDAHALVRAGADVVLGHHPHRIQGIEYYKKGVIAYSLANFVFSPATAGSTDTYILKVKLGNSGIEKASAVPVSIQRGEPRVKSAQSSAGKRIMKVIRSKSRALGTVTSASGNVLTFKK